MLGHVQRSSRNLTVRCQIVWNDVDLGMIVVTAAVSFVKVSILLLVVIRNPVKLNSFKIEVGAKIRIL